MQRTKKEIWNYKPFLHLFYMFIILYVSELFSCDFRFMEQEIISSQIKEGSKSLYMYFTIVLHSVFVVYCFLYCKNIVMMYSSKKNNEYNSKSQAQTFSYFSKHNILFFLSISIFFEFFFSHWNNQNFILQRTSVEKVKWVTCITNRKHYKCVWIDAYVMETKWYFFK